MSNIPQKTIKDIFQFFCLQQNKKHFFEHLRNCFFGNILVFENFCHIGHLFVGSLLLSVVSKIPDIFKALSSFRDSSIPGFLGSGCGCGRVLSCIYSLFLPCNMVMTLIAILRISHRRSVGSTESIVLVELDLYQHSDGHVRWHTICKSLTASIPKVVLSASGLNTLLLTVVCGSSFWRYSFQRKRIHVLMLGSWSLFHIG